MEPREHYKSNICSILCLYLFEKSFIALALTNTLVHLWPARRPSSKPMSGMRRATMPVSALSSLGPYSVRRCLHVRWTGACLCGGFCEQIG
jgi:hypothetical protein